MPAFERKQIHSVLSKNPYVTTHSEGMSLIATWLWNQVIRQFYKFNIN